MRTIATANARAGDSWAPAGLLIALAALVTALPAWGITEISSDGRTTVTTGLDRMTLEDPSVGSPVYDCGEVKEWLDADYAWDCKDWTFTGSGYYDGDGYECWIRSNNGDRLSTTSSVSDQIVAIHMAGDQNDGVAELYVDGELTATLDGYNDSPPADYAQVIVGCIGNVTHSIEVRATGVSPGAGNGNDVALLGAAVCAPEVEAGTEATCNDCADNDSDGDADCADADCSGFSGCESGTELTCDDNFDNDADGNPDCADADCDGAGVCEYGTELTCDDSIDNDADGDIDCADADCDGVGVCEYGFELTCDDSIDNDADGDVDCQDWDCGGDPACPTLMGAPNPALLAVVLLVAALCVITWRQRQRRVATW